MKISSYKDMVIVMSLQKCSFWRNEKIIIKYLVIMFFYLSAFSAFMIFFIKIFYL
jgi:hypothetical protein